MMNLYKIIYNNTTDGQYFGLLVAALENDDPKKVALECCGNQDCIPEPSEFDSV